jgi:HTH-type transcriptional regulator / antitoxin HigA
MTQTDSFLPRWASPPGDTIRDALRERGQSQSHFAASIGLRSDEFDHVLSGDKRITIELARSLSSSLGGSVQFWIERDGQYHEDMVRVELDRWSSSLPVIEMARWGWITRPHDWKERIEFARQFFGVGTVDEWRQTYGQAIARARFRASSKAPADPVATTAWLRQAERVAEAIPVEDYQSEAFRAVLSGIKSLTRIGDPGRFVPDLASRCASAGVAVAVVRAPSGCRASGASWISITGRRTIALTGRYLADDHFWFTFFHEAGHILLHSSVPILFIDEIEHSRSLGLSSDEQQADDFASDILLPADVQAGLQPGSPTPLEVRRIAGLAGVSSGVVVGQLQHLGRLPYRSSLNRLKRRFRWSGATLERV